MVFSSLIFLFAFLPCVLFFYFVPFKNSRIWKNFVLLASSLVFYAWGEPLFVCVMVFSILLNYCLGLLINLCNQKDKKAAKVILVLAVIWNVGLLFVFKYLSFIADTINQAIARPVLPGFEIALPIGISFFTFQILSYIIDVYKQKVNVQKNVFSLALYVSLFPQLIAGPIVRYQTIEDQIQNRKETMAGFTAGFERFAIGLAKKCLLANYMAIIADTMFEMNNADLTLLAAWLGAIAYTLQIYLDFSGYSDMAIGLGLIFGFKFEENFNYPYAARSITDFWRRWHISLSSWFRDYVYIPLGGNRCSPARCSFNLFVVWLLTGIWHGANFTFWCWGFFYFVLLQFERSTAWAKRAENAKGIKLIFMRILCLIFVVCGWVLFRSSTLGQAKDYLLCMFGAAKIDVPQVTFLLTNVWFVLLVSVLVCVPFKTMLPFLFTSDEEKIARMPKIAVFCRNVFAVIRPIFIFCIFVISLLNCIQATYNPFIYFNF